MLVQRSESVLLLTGCALAQQQAPARNDRQYAYTVSADREHRALLSTVPPEPVPNPESNGGFHSALNRRRTARSSRNANDIHRRSTQLDQARSRHRRARVNLRAQHWDRRLSNQARRQAAAL